MDTNPIAKTSQNPIQSKSHPPSSNTRQYPPGEAPHPIQVNISKTKKTYCKGKKSRKHTLHKVTQYKKRKDSLTAQGKRRYDHKQSGYGYGWQTKPVFHKKVIICYSFLFIA
ncbi:hypothetical protein L1049_022185 [Liquidambar formosana]|uniref:Uncharacterized protein n=1 Tax=Liquidambar formosana TaxID=63359 RepID=A0AAP0WQT6_LIQFO